MLIRILVASVLVFSLAVAAHGAQPSGSIMDEAYREARVEHYEEQIRQMRGEIDVAIDAGGGPVVIMAAVDEILARYQPEFESFAALYDAVMEVWIAEEEDAEVLAYLIAARAESIPAILAVPGQVRAEIEAEVAPPVRSKGHASPVAMEPLNPASFLERLDRLAHNNATGRLDLTGNHERG